MQEPHARQHLLPGEAARRLARDAAGHIVGAVGKAPLAPGVVGVALFGERAARVGDHRDRAEMVLVEVAESRGFMISVEGRLRR